MGQSMIKYGTWTPEAAASDVEEAAKASGGEFMKIEEGRNVLRFLPPKEGQAHPFVKVQQHFIKSPEGKSGGFACPRAHAKMQCPACDRVEQLRATGVGADRKAASDMAAKLRVFANVINRNAPDLGPQKIAFGKSVWTQLLQLRTDEDAGGDFTDPINGFDVILTRKGSGMDTEYFVAPARQSSPLGELEWIEAQANLAQYAMPRSTAEILELLGEDPDEARDVTPPSRQLASKPKPSAPLAQPRRTAQDLADEDAEE
jgi:hypothetical protein